MRVHVGVVCVALVLGLVGCSSAASVASVTSVDGTVSDQMYTTDVQNAELAVFQMDGRTYTADDYMYEVDIAGAEPLRDGGFYVVHADVEYLNGGIAGYVNYPDVKRVHGCVETSPLSMGLAALGEKLYGLTLIGDYADGDVLYYGSRGMAVWKDGDWVYRYDEVIDLPNGTKAGVRDGVSADDVQAGMDAGVLSCADYFVLPGV